MFAKTRNKLKVSRRGISAHMHAGFFAVVAGLIGLAAADGAEQARPNILWISLEDLSPDLGCYGAPHVKTPHIDKMARDAVRFEQAFSTAGVCAPSRSAIISGVYQMTLGTQHMRSTMPKPAGLPTLPELMKAHGYYCTNNSKQDYNFPGTGMWHDSTPKAHWRNRPSASPFFSVFNLTMTHESVTWQVVRGAKELRARGLDRIVVEPASITVPAIYADTPGVRAHLANYYNLISLADAQVGEILQALRDDGLHENTIVMLWGDHGRGLPRGKFWLYTLSTRVPLILYVLAPYRGLFAHERGSVDRGLRSLLDLFPTTLTAAGIPRPAHLAGQSLFELANDKRVLLSGRDRLGSRQDLARAVRTQDWLYIRNYTHDGAYVPRNFTGQSWTRSPIQVEMWKQQPDLNRAQAVFFSARQRPAEELYALASDPDETTNLAGDPRFAAALAERRTTLDRKLSEIKDTGFTPEFELYETLTKMDQRRENVVSPAFSGWPAAPGWLSASGQATHVTREVLLRDTNSEMVEQRYWATRELLNQPARLNEKELAALRPRLRDSSVDVRLQATRLFIREGKHDEVLDVLRNELRHPYVWSRCVALGIIADELPITAAASLLDAVNQCKPGGYVDRIQAQIKERLAEESSPGAAGSD
jgi:N-sulfoglucosamine sulfohydrolase